MPGLTHHTGFILILLSTFSVQGQSLIKTFDPHTASGVPFADRGDIIFEAGQYLFIGSGHVDFQDKRVTNLLKIDLENFRVVDSAEFNGPQGDQNFVAGMPGDDGYLYFTGEWFDFTALRMRMFLAKYTTDFNLVWINYFPELDHPDFAYYAYDLCQAHDGGIVMVYNRQDFDTPRAVLDTRILKSDTAGNVVFNKLLADTMWLSQGRGNISTLDGRTYLVTTYSEQENASELEDFIMHQVNEAGEVVWTRVEDGSLYGPQPPRSIMLDNGGGAVTWIKDTLVIFDNNEWFTRFHRLNTYDSLGNASWNHTWWTIQNAPILDLHKASNGDILGCGFYDDFNGWNKSWIYRFSPEGELKWQRIYNDSLNRPFAPTQTPLFFSGMTELQDRRLAITGFAFDTSNYPGSNGANANVLLMVLDSAGCLQPGCEGETQIILSADDWHFIGSIPMSSLSISPNPASGRICVERTNSINSTSRDLVLNAYTNAGILIWSGEWRGDPISIDVSQWPQELITVIALQRGQPIAIGNVVIGGN